jgi:hypothetical protein
MEIIFEFIMGFIWEIGANLLFEFLFELGLRSIFEPFRKSDQRHPVLAFIGCIILGTGAGFLSTVILPNQMFHPKHLQGYGLLFVPLFCGISMSGLRRLRERQGKQVVFMDSFVYGYTFAFFMTLVRYYYTAW